MSDTEATPDGERWYVDAWSVFDGLCFASRREHDSLHADAIVFLCAPYFEPEPVVSLATAKAATRRGFQDGFRDENGLEIPFESLEQIVAAVRTAYRASSQGDPEDSSSGMPTPTPPNSDPGGDHMPLEEVISPQVREVWPKFLLSVLAPNQQHTRAHRERSALAFVDACFDNLLPRFLGDTIAGQILTDGVGASRCPDGAQIAPWACLCDLMNWRFRLDKRSLRLRGDHWGPLAGARVLEDALGGSSTSTKGSVFEAFARDPDFDMAHAIGIPPSWRSPFGKMEIWTLEQAATAAVVDSGLAGSWTSPLGAMPLLAMGLLGAASRSITTKADRAQIRTPRALRRLRAVTAAWIVRVAPSGVLAGHPAQNAIATLQRSVLLVRAETMRRLAGEDDVADDWQSEYLATQNERVSQALYPDNEPGLSGGEIRGLMRTRGGSDDEPRGKLFS